MTLSCERFDLTTEAITQTSVWWGVPTYFTTSSRVYLALIQSNGNRTDSGNINVISAPGTITPSTQSMPSSTTTPTIPTKSSQAQSAGSAGGTSTAHAPTSTQQTQATVTVQPHPLSPGAEAGIALGAIGIAALLLVAALLIWRRRRRSTREAVTKSYMSPDTVQSPTFTDSSRPISYELPAHDRQISQELYSGPIR